MLQYIRLLFWLSIISVFDVLDVLTLFTGKFPISTNLCIYLNNLTRKPKTNTILYIISSDFITNLDIWQGVVSLDPIRYY